MSNTLNGLYLIGGPFDGTKMLATPGQPVGIYPWFDVSVLVVNEAINDTKHAVGPAGTVLVGYPKKGTFTVTEAQEGSPRNRYHYLMVVPTKNVGRVGVFLSNDILPAAREAWFNEHGFKE